MFPLKLITKILTFYNKINLNMWNPYRENIYTYLNNVCTCMHICIHTPTHTPISWVGGVGEMIKNSLLPTQKILSTNGERKKYYY